MERAKAAARQHPEVARVGVTTTTDGRWALKIWLRPGVQPPLADIGESLGDYPVVYDREPDPDDLPVARPAYPKRGE